MEGRPSNIVIWQWNCCGSQRKKAVLQQFIRSHPNKPHIILLQETLTGSFTLSGYRSHCLFGQDKSGLCTLVSKKFTTIVHDLSMNHTKTEHLLIELVPNGQLRNSLFILNIYSTPRDMRQRFTSLMSKAVGKAGGAPLIIAGDFNAPHQAWGYHHTNAKGRDLWQAASDHNLTLITDPSFPTRIGNSCSRDTTPDLTFVANSRSVIWQNLNESLGSDHYILATSMEVQSRPPREFKFTDWELFRTIREQGAEDRQSPEHNSERMWLRLPSL